MERTFGIIKPDAVDERHIGHVISGIEKAGLKLVAMKLVHLSKEEAAGFYAVHKKRPFFKSLLKYITSGPVVVMAMEGENAIEKWRKLMGPTDSTKAPKSTLRGKYGKNIEENACHGSDAPETAAVELGYFFNALEYITPKRKK